MPPAAGSQNPCPRLASPPITLYRDIPSSIPQGPYALPVQICTLGSDQSSSSPCFHPGHCRFCFSGPVLVLSSFISFLRIFTPSSSSLKLPPPFLNPRLQHKFPRLNKPNRDRPHASQIPSNFLTLTLLPCL